jgi:ABC-2 type transport system ATP-binding protein
MPRDAERLRPVAGYMTQRFSLYEDLDVTENLEFAAEIFGLAGRRRRERVAAVLARYGLDAFARVRAGALSGGWKQRLGLAAATIHEPELLVLDEPTAGVDPQSRRAFWEQIFQLAGAGTTVFVSTHYMDEAVRCHRLCILRDGRRVALATPARLARALDGRVLEAAVEAAPAAIAALAESPLVASTTQLGDSVHVLLRDDAPRADEAAGSIERFLRERGVPAQRIAPGTPVLEDVFVALLRGERLDEEGAA